MCGSAPGSAVAARDARHPRHRPAAAGVVTRTMLLEAVWDYNFHPQTNVVDVHISKLRQGVAGERCADRAVKGSASAPPPARTVRSFVTRARRITPAQQRALSELWPRFGLDYAPQALQAEALFGRRAPLTLEIGFGNGDNLLALARAHPERDYLGIEVHRPGVGRLLLGIAEHGLGNVRVICHDAVE